MGRLGYERYGAQGGDWGAAVTTQIGRNGGRCAAIHVNMPLGFPVRQPGQPDRGGEGRRWRRGSTTRTGTPATPSSSRHVRRPLGYGLVDSPVGQLAWIVEKFWSWMDCDGHPENVLTRDEMLDNVMLYWLTASGASSARLYWESFNFFGGFDRVELPTGIASFPKEILQGAAQLVRGRLQHHPLDDDAARRPLRGVRAARAVRRRREPPSSTTVR